MKKSEMQMKLRRQLERRQEDMVRELRNGDSTTAMIYYGSICGLADAMRIVGLVDWEQSTKIREQAMALYRRVREACQEAGAHARDRVQGVQRAIRGMPREAGRRELALSALGRGPGGEGGGAAADAGRKDTEGADGAVCQGEPLSV